LVGYNTLDKLIDCIIGVIIIVISGGIRIGRLRMIDKYI